MAFDVAAKWVYWKEQYLAALKEIAKEILEVA
jgi:hypothetical protein